MLPDMTHRAQLSELMDDPDCCEELLMRTIAQLTSINLLVSRYRAVLKRWVLKDMMKAPGQVYHLVDMGAGGGDIDAWLVRKARALGLRLRVTACDLDPRIADYARKKYGHIEEITIREHDLLKDHFDQPVDYVFANHFLHHLKDEEIIHLLRHWQPLVRRRMVISDLERHPLAYVGFSMLSLVYRNSFTRPDGLVSIRRGFRSGELLHYARKALPHCTNRVQRVFPGRLVLCIEGNPLRMDSFAIQGDIRSVNS